MTPSAIPDTPGSGPNAPHANADDDDPAAFFGDDGEDGAEEHSLMPEAGAEEASTDESVSDAPAPSIGEALPGQTLSEDGETIQTVGEEGSLEPEAKLAPVGEGAEDPEQAAEHAEWEAEQARQREDEATKLEEAAKMEEAAAEGEDPKPAAGADKTPPANEAAAPPKNGPRGYVVVREIQLTKEFLDHFQKSLEEGKEPHTIYMILEPKVEARNPAPVLTAAFKKHYKRLGQPLRLAAIPLSMWKVRTLSLKPKVIDDNIAIED